MLWTQYHLIGLFLIKLKQHLNYFYIVLDFVDGISLSLHSLHILPNQKILFIIFKFYSGLPEV